MTTESLPFTPTVIVHDEKKSAPCARSSSGAGQLSSTLWFAGWLFTIGFLRLVWWKALLAILVWPYFLGLAFR